VLEQRFRFDDGLVDYVKHLNRARTRSRRASSRWRPTPTPARR
jgi:hypothetical protein